MIKFLLLVAGMSLLGAWWASRNSKRKPDDNWFV